MKIILLILISLSAAFLLLLLYEWVVSKMNLYKVVRILRRAQKRHRKSGNHKSANELEATIREVKRLWNETE